MYLYRRQAVKRFHNRFIGNLHGFPHTLSLYQLGSHTAGRNGGSAAKGFELHIPDNPGLINIQIYSHDIAAFGIPYSAHTARILYFPHITGMLKMIHYFFAVHISSFPYHSGRNRLPSYLFCFLIKSS